MKLKARILPEFLTQILRGDKQIEIRALETITLTDGKREHTFNITGIDQQDTDLWAMSLPGLFNYDHPIIAIYLGKEVVK